MTARMHRSVLLEEAINFLNVKPGGLYVDGTLGLGGHAEEILKRLGQQGGLLGLDVDPKNLETAERRLQPFGNLTRTRQVNFRGLQGALQSVDWNEVDGMLFDLGVASPQLDTAERGFSFQSDGPLDMRLDPTRGQTALRLLHTIDERKFENLLGEFGEQRFAKRLSREILTGVASGHIKTTKQLAGICERVIGRQGKTHPATRVFLAIRCLVNDELGALKDLLEEAPKHLKIGGRLVFISFHSLEDRMVKERFRELAPISGPRTFSVLTKKPVVPSPDEEQSNARARSAKLRALERVA